MTESKELEIRNYDPRLTSARATALFDPFDIIQTREEEMH